LTNRGTARRTSRLGSSYTSSTLYVGPTRLSRGTLGGAAAAYVKRLQSRIGEQEKCLIEYKLYVAERHASKEYLGETKREILESIRDLARRIDQHS
jgi:hypothetical protein